MPFKIKQGVSLPVIPKSSITNVVSKIQQGDEAGNKLNTTRIAAYPAASQYLAVDSGTPDIRVVVPHFYPSLCPSTSATKSATNPLSQSLEQLYNALVGSAYDTTNFNRADVGKHCIMSEGFLCGIDMIDRFLDNFNIQEYGNLGPIAFKRAQGFTNSHNGGLLSFTDLVSARNELVPLFNKLLVPSSLPWLQKHRYLVRHIFADDTHKKTGFIIPRIHVLYTTLNGSNNNVAPMSGAVYNPQSNINDIVNFIFQLKADLTDYIDSAFYKEMSPYLWRAMCQKNGPQIDKPYQISEYTKIQPSSDVDILFDYRIIQMIRNADYIGIPFNMRVNNPSNDSNMYIYEDNSMNLRQGSIGDNNVNTYGIAVVPYYVHKGVNNTTPASSLQLENITFDDYCNPSKRWWEIEGHPAIGTTRHINTEDWPSSDEAVYYALNCNVIIEAFPTHYTTTECFKITSCGDTTFMYFDLITVSNTVAGHVISNSFVPALILTSHVATIVGGYLDYINLVASPFTSTAVQYLFGLTSYLCCPVISIIYYNNSNNNKLFSEDLFIDKDNIITFSNDVLYKLHNYIMYNAMLITSLQVKGSGKPEDNK